MRISIKTKKRKLLIATGDDAEQHETEEQVEWIQMNGADLSIAPEPEGDYYEEEEEEEWIPSEMGTPKKPHSFGFAPRSKPNML